VRPVVDPAVVRAVAARLAAAGIPSPEVDARLLVEHAHEVGGTPAGCGAALLDGLVARRIAREPLQIVLGRTWFRTLELTCAAGVFVPRPETEVVAGVAIGYNVAGIAGAFFAAPVIATCRVLGGYSEVGQRTRRSRPDEDEGASESWRRHRAHSQLPANTSPGRSRWQ
jgi:hypothetical protein